MAKAPKLSTPGSIFVPAKCNKIYIKFKGKTFSTGLAPDRHGYALAKALLEKKFLDYHNLKFDETVVTFGDAWEAYLRTMIKLSPRTIYSYQHAFEKIIKDKDEYMTNERLENNVLKFIGNTGKLSVTSVNTFLGKFQLFVNYCAEKKWIEPYNFNKKYSSKQSERSALSYTDEECELILRYFDKHNVELAYYIRFMLATGARVVDALNLRWADIDFDNERITWKNKNTKTDEQRPASKEAIALLMDLKAMNKAKVFSWNYSSSSRLAKRLNTCFESIGIAKNRRGFQEFRVTFRMRLLYGGVPEHYIEYLLRHSSGKLIYTNYTDKKETEKIIRKYINKD